MLGAKVRLAGARLDAARKLEYGRGVVGARAASRGARDHFDGHQLDRVGV